MPDQVQNPNIKFQDQGLTSATPGIEPVAPPAPVPPVPPALTGSGLGQDPAASNQAPIEPVPLPKMTDVEKPVEPAVTSAAEAVPVKEEVNPLFEKPVIVAPGTDKDDGRWTMDDGRKKKDEGHKLPKGVIAGIAALVFLVVMGIGGGLYLLKTPGVGDIKRQAAGTCPFPDENTGACAIYTCPNGCTDGQCQDNGGLTSCDTGIGGTCGQVDEECRRPDGSTYWRLKGGELNCSGSCAGTGGGGGNGGDGGDGGRSCDPPERYRTCYAYEECTGDGGCSDICHYECNGSQVLMPNSGCGSWTDWSACSVPCDGGTQTRNRVGSSSSNICETQTQSCNTQPCLLSITPIPTDVTPTATPTPVTISANCESLAGQMSDGAGGWTTKTDADFAAQARPGDGVRFVCTGHKTQGNFTKSAFFINNVLHVDDVVKLNETQFAVEYTIGAAGALKVESVLLHDSQGWVD